MKVVLMSNLPNQSFRVQLKNDLEITISLYWNQVGRKWDMSFHRNDREETIYGLSLVSGSNLLGQVPNWDLYAFYLSAQQILRDPTRQDIESGALYIGPLTDFADLIDPSSGSLQNA